MSCGDVAARAVALALPGAIGEEEDWLEADTWRLDGIFFGCVGVWVWVWVWVSWVLGFLVGRGRNGVWFEREDVKEMEDWRGVQQR